MLKFLVKQQKIEILEREIIASDQIQFVNLKFMVEGDWKKFYKVVQFTQNDETYNRVLGFDGLSCLLPSELHAGAVKMSVFGYDADNTDGLRATTVQEESFSASENQKWKIKRNFEQGKIGSITMLGYKRNKNGELEIVPKEAEIVRMIFQEYLSGLGKSSICNKLNKMQIRTKQGYQWTPEGIRRILRNEKYCGDLLLQKSFRENHITKRKMENNGEYPQYYIEEAHEPIIDRDTFLAVQELMKEKQCFASKKSDTTYPFTSMIKCGCCGKFYRRKVQPYRLTWICSTYNSKGKKYCPDSKQIPEDRLYSASCEVLGLEEFDEKIFKKNICQIIVPAPNLLTFCFHDGHEQTVRWQDHSRTENWTAKNNEKRGENHAKTSKIHSA